MYLQSVVRMNSQKFSPGWRFPPVTRHTQGYINICEFFFYENKWNNEQPNIYSYIQILSLLG